jgi:c(7)-type cytochrome triheme protein
LAQFVTPNIPLCNICHTDLSAAGAPLKNFPENFKESFNVKFDHAEHMRGEARPQQGCAFCHDRPLRRGVALSIPATLSAHGNCYTCHTPESRSSAGRDIGSCGACHEQAPYARTSTNAVAFRLSFSHADHGARQRLGCADCHSIIAGLAQSRQVSAPRTVEHFATGRAMSCLTCHNGKRAFGGDLAFLDCKRCHKGPTFRMPI